MADTFIRRQKLKENGGFSITQCLNIFGLSRSGYYGWKNHQEDTDGSLAEKKKERDDLKEKMLEVIRYRQGAVPGKRTFRTELFRLFRLTVSIKKIAALMKEMNLAAQRPHKDAYKHQAVHNHLCTAPSNIVGQEFYTGPRKVILTDITYLYYGHSRDTFYLCVFRDAYTRENLGWSAGLKMDTGLVAEAYQAMLEKYGQQLHCEEVLVHHDQGSQYLSSTFRKLLSDEGFVQSVSERGNSQDNAPMESFFGRLKCDLLDLVARCVSFEDAVTIINGYMDSYNNKYHQYELAGLCPAEFYLYVTTGIYPLSSYFGIPADRLSSLSMIKDVRRRYADENASRRREASHKKKELPDPLTIVKNDIEKLRKSISKSEKIQKIQKEKEELLRKIMNDARKAETYILSLGPEQRDELRDPLKWSEHAELAYIFDMDEMF